MKFILPIASLFILLAHFQTHSAQCQGQIMGINSGRGAVGFIFSLDESRKQVNAESVAKFSSAAMAYDPDMQRIYYTSSPRSQQYALDTAALNLAQGSPVAVKGTEFKANKLV